MPKLSAKQKRFVDEYLIDLNATQAATRAGYSPKTANEQGARLLVNVSIQAEIQKRMKEREERTEISQDRVLKELAAIGFADVADYAKVVANGPIAIVRLTPTDDIPHEKRAAIAGIKEGANGVEVKLNDKLKALELLGKHLGLFERQSTGEYEDLRPLSELLNDDTDD